MKGKTRRTLPHAKNAHTKKEESKDKRCCSVSMPPNINDINKTEIQETKITTIENTNSKQIRAKRLNTPPTREQDLYRQLNDCSQTNLREYCVMHNLSLKGSKTTLIDHIVTHLKSTTNHSFE